jgi:hypothetical protein
MVQQCQQRLSARKDEDKIPSKIPSLTNGDDEIPRTCQDAVARQEYSVIGGEAQRELVKLTDTPRTVPSTGVDPPARILTALQRQWRESS